MSHYTVNAYRWGSLNTHGYPVYVGTDKTKAFALAQSECESRGGKYACDVCEWNADGTNFQQIAYFRSMMEEDDSTGPIHNHRIDYYEHLGHFLDDYADGAVWTPGVPDGNGHRFLTRQEVPALPQVMRGEVERQRKLLDIWTTMLTRVRLKSRADASVEDIECTCRYAAQRQADPMCGRHGAEGGG